jgi:hypothetical protein
VAGPVDSVSAPAEWKPRVQTSANEWADPLDVRAVPTAASEPVLVDVDPLIVVQVATEAANWILYRALTTVEEPIEKALGPFVDELRKGTLYDEAGTTTEDGWKAIYDLTVKLFTLCGGGGGGGGGGSGEGEGDGDGRDGQSNDEDGGNGEDQASGCLLDDVQSDPTRAKLSQLLPSMRPTTDSNVTEKQREALAKMLQDPHIAKFLDLIGRISHKAWLPAQVPSPLSFGGVVDVELGANVARLLSSEVMRFGVPALSGMAYLDLLNRRLLQTAMRGTEPQGRGDLLVGLDMSGSMVSGVHEFQATRFDVARALALAVVRIADVQNRKVRIVGFNAGVLFDQRAHDPTTRAALMLTLAHRSPDGSTDFDPPVEALLDKPPGNADLLMITDGAATLGGTALAKLIKAKAGGLRLFTLFIGVAPNGVLQGHSILGLPLRSEADLRTLGDALAGH